MAMMKRNPLSELLNMQEEMNRLFELSRSRMLGEPLEDGLWQPAVDLYEDDREVVLKMEVPEVDQEDISVSIEENTLIVQGVRHLEREERKQNYHRIERCYGHFRRTFNLPASVDQGRVTAACDRGVLKIVLAKRDTGPPRQIEVGKE
jgi:HSP20 family protein